MNSANFQGRAYLFSFYWSKKNSNPHDSYFFLLREKKKERNPNPHPQITIKNITGQKNPSTFQVFSESKFKKVSL